MHIHTHLPLVHSRVRNTYTLVNLGEMEHSLSNGGLDNTLSLVSQHSFSHLLDQLDHLKGHLLGHVTPHVPSLHLDSPLPHDRLWTEEARECDSCGTSVPHEGLEDDTCMKIILKVPRRNKRRSPRVSPSRRTNYHLYCQVHSVLHNHNNY